MTEHDAYHKITIKTLESISSYMDSLVWMSGTLVVICAVATCIIVYDTLRK